MFDDCNNFFKGKADERVRRPAAVTPPPKGIGSGSLLSAVCGGSAQYLHHPDVVLSEGSRDDVRGFARVAGLQGPAGRLSATS